MGIECATVDIRVIAYFGNADFFKRLGLKKLKETVLDCFLGVSYSPVFFLLLTATEKRHTDVPPAVALSSQSRVKRPTSTTTLMSFAISSLL